MPIKFLNCNRREVDLSLFRPYDLVTVNNKMCGIGETIQGFKIVAITKETIEFEAPSGARRAISY